MELRYQEPSEIFPVKVYLEEKAVPELLTSLKDNVPKATGALYDCVNKYHEEYTGLNLKDASLKVRESLQNGAELAYLEVVWQIDEVNKTLGRVARGTTQAYQLLNDKAQNLYQGLLDQEGQVDFQKLQNKVLDSLIGVTEDYKVIVNRLIDLFIDFFKSVRLQLPGRAGTYTIDEICTMVIREIGNILSQVHSKIHNALETWFSYFQDLMEKSELIKDLKITFPFGPRSHKLTDTTLAYGKLLKSLSQNLQKVFNDLQSNKTTEMLGDLQRYLQNVFQELQGEMNRLKEKKFTILINDIRHKINTAFNGYVQYVLRFLKENVYPKFAKFNELVQNKLQEASAELEKIRQYVGALQKEYFDPNVVSWRMKYYELEEKIINLIKMLVDGLKDFYSKYSARVAGFASQLSSEFEPFV